MENNKAEFRRTGVKYCGAELIEIQISQTGDLARYRSTVKQVCGPSIVTNGRWQTIRCNRKNGYAYIKTYNKKLYLHEFLRIY